MRTSKVRVEQIASAVLEARGGRRARRTVATFDLFPLGRQADGFRGLTIAAGADVPDSPGRLGPQGARDPLLPRVLPPFLAGNHLPRFGLR
jgi:hypothetical protein